MMHQLRYTLLSDGSSDASLLPILTWLLRSNGVAIPIQPEWADLGRLRLPEKPSLSDKISRSLGHYPCDLLFVHRDAETEARIKRVQEIESAFVAIESPGQPVVCVVPVRMMEAWLLFDEAAIKWAAQNRNYREALDLPPINRLEDISNPKELLHSLLRKASGLSNRRLRRFSVHTSVRRLAEYLSDFSDFSPLRQLSAFQALESDIQSLIAQQRWDG